MNENIQIHSLEDARRGMRQDQLDYCAREWAAGKNTQEIASALGVSEARVFNRVEDWMPHARRIAAAKRAALQGGKSPSTLTVIGGGKP